MRPISTLSVILLSMLIALGLAEAGARALGYAPFAYAVDRWEPSFFLSDTERGWRNKPGKYEYSYLPENAYPVSITIGPDGERTSRPHGPVKARLDLYGGSLGFGWGVSDGETLADKLAKQGYHVDNYSSGGYGGLQALQTMQLREEKWRAGAEKPTALIYLQVTHHTNRSAGDAAWMLGNERGNPRDGALVGIPYASLNAADALVIHPPTRIWATPLRQHSALSNLLQQALAFLRFPTQMDAMRPVQARIVEQMADLAARNGLPLLVVGLYSQQADFDALRSMVIAPETPWVNCTSPDFPSGKGAQVPNDGHPTAIIHAQYAQCILRQALQPNDL